MDRELRALRLSQREWSGGVDDQFARAQADDRHDAAEVCSKKPERIGQDSNVFREFFHEKGATEVSAGRFAWTSREHSRETEF